MTSLQCLKLTEEDSIPNLLAIIHHLPHPELLQELHLVIPEDASATQLEHGFHLLVGLRELHIDRKSVFEDYNHEHDDFSDDDLMDMDPYIPPDSTVSSALAAVRFG